MHELVLKIEIEAERDADGKPTFHYERRHRPDGSFWYAQRVPHVNVTVVYGFPETEIPAKKKAEERAHAQRFIAVTSREPSDPQGKLMPMESRKHVGAEAGAGEEAKMPGAADTKASEKAAAS